MYDMVGVAVMNTLQYLLDAVRCILLSVELPGNDVIKQFTSGHKVKDHVAHVVFLVNEVQPNYNEGQSTMKVKDTISQ